MNVSEGLCVSSGNVMLAFGAYVVYDMAKSILEHRQKESMFSSLADRYSSILSSVAGVFLSSRIAARTSRTDLPVEMESLFRTIPRAQNTEASTTNTESEAHEPAETQTNTQ